MSTETGGEGGSFAPLGTYEGHDLAGRFVPRTEDGRFAEYQVEVVKDGRLRYRAAVYIPPVDLELYDPATRVGKMEEDALSYARMLIDMGTQPTEEPYRREASLLA
jgi:hypothetical protein